ncbi:hypothetical protein ACE6H2_023151 [Prunus campanulata]
MQYSFSGFLTQVVDSFIIFAAQQSDAKNIELPSSLPSGEPSYLKVPWTSYGPSNMRIVPFPTREYTDDEFQSIIKSVMGVLYVSLEFFISIYFFCFSISVYFFCFSISVLFKL